MKNKGFTLVELIIYLGIMSFFSVVIIGFLIDLVKINQREKIIRAVNFDFNNISYEVSKAIRKSKEVLFYSSLWEQDLGRIYLKTNNDQLIRIRTDATADQSLCLEDVSLGFGSECFLLTSPEVKVEKFWLSPIKNEYFITTTTERQIRAVKIILELTNRDNSVYKYTQKQELTVNLNVNP